MGCKFILSSNRSFTSFLLQCNYESYYRNVGNLKASNFIILLELQQQKAQKGILFKAVFVTCLGN